MNQLSLFSDLKVKRSFDYVYEHPELSYFYKPPYFEDDHPVRVVKCFVLNGCRRIVLHDKREFEYVDDERGYIPLGEFYELLSSYVGDTYR